MRPSNDESKSDRCRRAAFDQPLKVVRIETEVVVTGPEHMHGAFNAEAAQKSAERLEEIAEEARQAERDAAEDDQAGEDDEA